MKIFLPSPEARFTAQALSPVQPVEGFPQISVAVTSSHDPAGELAPADGAGVAALLIGKEGQPCGLPTFLAREMQPPALFIESPLVTSITQHIERSLENQSPWRAWFTQLSWMPHTKFGNKVGLTAFERMSWKAVDWLIFCAGLVIGVAALPTLYPFARCNKAYDAVVRLRDGMADLQLASELLKTARALPEVTEATAQNVLQVYRGQACHFRMLSVVHRSDWSLLAETELLTYFDSKIPGFSLQVRAQNVRDNRNAMLLKLGTSALVMATRPRPVERTQADETSSEISTEKHEERQKWDQWNHFAQMALGASSYV